MFIINVSYKKDLSEVEKFLKEHRAYLDTFYAQKKLLMSGPRNPRSGGVIISLFSTAAEAQSFIKGDPFHREGIANYDVIEFQPTKSLEVIAEFRVQ